MPVLFHLGHQRSHSPQRNIANGIDDLPQQICKHRPADYQNVHRRLRFLVEAEVDKAQSRNYEQRQRHVNQKRPTFAPFRARSVDDRPHYRIVYRVPHSGDSHYRADGDSGDQQRKLEIIRQSRSDYVVDDVLPYQTAQVKVALFRCVRTHLRRGNGCRVSV